MANINDIISKAVASAAGNVAIPENVKGTVLNGLSESVLGSLTQTATKAGGIDLIKGLLTGKANAATSPITALAGKLFTNNILKNLNLGGSLNGALSGLIPVIMGKLGGILKDQDGDGDVDFQDILITLGVASAPQKKASPAGSVLGTAGTILGSILKKK